MIYLSWMDELRKSLPLMMLLANSFLSVSDSVLHVLIAYNMGHLQCLYIPGIGLASILNDKGLGTVESSRFSFQTSPGQCTRGIGYLHLQNSHGYLMH